MAVEMGASGSHQPLVLPLSPKSSVVIPQLVSSLHPATIHTSPPASPPLAPFTVNNQPSLCWSSSHPSLHTAQPPPGPTLSFTPPSTVSVPVSALAESAAQSPLLTSAADSPAAVARAVVEQQELAWREAAATASARLARQEISNTEAQDRVLAEALLVEDNTTALNDRAIAAALQQDFDRFLDSQGSGPSTPLVMPSTSVSGKRTSRTSAAAARPLTVAEVGSAKSNRALPTSAPSDNDTGWQSVGRTASQPIVQSSSNPLSHSPLRHHSHPLSDHDSQQAPAPAQPSVLPSVSDPSLSSAPLLFPSLPASTSIPYLAPLPSAASSELPADVTCQICTRLYRRPVQLPCSHSFCLECVRKWADVCQETAELKRKESVSEYGLSTAEIERVQDKLDSFARVELSQRCSICCMVEDADDCMLKCASCKLRVHESCYGTVAGQDDSGANGKKRAWKCEPCSLGARPEDLVCVLCRNKQDRAYKRTRGPLPDGRISRYQVDRLFPTTFWVHVSCAHYHHEPCFSPPEDGGFHSPIFKLDSHALKAKISKLTCMFCRAGPAASLQCNFGSWYSLSLTVTHAGAARMSLFHEQSLTLSCPCPLSLSVLCVCLSVCVAWRIARVYFPSVCLLGVFRVV